MNALRTTVHVLSVLAWALWMGGFTFYTAVSLRVAHKVLDDSNAFGFVTQVVTDRLNLIGVVAVILLLAQLAMHWPVFAKWRRILLSISWLILALTLWHLFATHDAIDALLDAKTRSVAAGFDQFHDLYEFVATVQWFTAVIHLVVMLTHSDKPPTNVAVVPPNQS